MTTRAPTADEQWYVRRGDEVRGPFPWEVIARHAGLGRIHDDDLLSRDRAHWQPSTELLADLPSRAVLAGSAADERGATRGGGPDGRERRADEDAAVVARRERAARVWAGIRADERAMPARVPLLAIALALVACLAVALRLSLPEAALAPDCRAPAAPGVNWEFCRLAGVDVADARLAELNARNAQLRGARFTGADLSRADLAYADLDGADFTLANLARARMVGASLREARLNHARLAGADLSHADLTGASLAGAELSATRLSNTIWVDGRVCPHDAVGTCGAR